MKKFFVIFLLLFIVVLTLGFSYLKYSSLGGPESYFNTNLRHKFARYPVWRKILSLHFDGDAKSDYLGRRHPKILIKVIEMEGHSVDEDILKEFVKRVEEATGKLTDHIYSSKKVAFQPATNIEELRVEMKALSRSDNVSDRAVLYVVVANKNASDDNAIGSTLN